MCLCSDHIIWPLPVHLLIEDHSFSLHEDYFSGGPHALCDFEPRSLPRSAALILVPPPTWHPYGYSLHLHSHLPDISQHPYVFYTYASEAHSRIDAAVDLDSSVASLGKNVRLLVVWCKKQISQSHASNCRYVEVVLGYDLLKHRKGSRGDWSELISRENHLVDIRGQRSEWPASH